MAERTTPASETTGVQDFILQRQASLLARAIDALTNCPLPTLPQELHRLSGTLGTYQLDEARAIVRDCEGILTVPGVAPADIERGRGVALERLQGLAR